MDSHTYRNILMIILLIVAIILIYNFTKKRENATATIGGQQWPAATYG